MNTPELDKLGYKPLEGDFARIAAIKTVSELAAPFAYFQKVAEPWGPTDSVAAPFRFLEMSDPEDSKQSIAEIEPSALSLEDRNYYLADDERSKRIRGAFLDQVTNLLALAGAPRDSALMQAHSILNLETKLAASELPPADKRDVSKSTHVLSLSDLRMLAPNVNWTLVFRELGLAESTRINVSEPEALKKVGEEMAAEPLENWRTWLRWRDIQLSARYLSKPFFDEVFHFQGTVLSGITQPPPRWRTCARFADRDLSDDLGQAYSAKYFPVEAKRRMLRLVENLRSAFQEQIQESDWMSARTKTQAVAKLKPLRIQIGYPDLWHDYSAVTISRADFLGSVRNS
jgi:predicted metalloendopeptidase